MGDMSTLGQGLFPNAPKAQFDCLGKLFVTPSVLVSLMVMVNAPLLVAVVEFTLKFSCSPCAPTLDAAEYNDEGRSESKIVAVTTESIRAVRSIMKEIF